MEPDGKKLAKSSRSVRLEVDTAISQLFRVFDLLNLKPPSELKTADIPDAWRWAIRQWINAPILRHLSLQLPR
jgi:hypothetical protein